MAITKTAGQHNAENIISIKVSLKAIIERDKPKMYVSYCPALDLCSQGETRKEAKKNIIEATELFIESCLEDNTLTEVLEECGFHSVYEKPKRKKSKTPVMPPVTDYHEVIYFSAELPVMAYG